MRRALNWLAFAALGAALLVLAAYAYLRQSLPQTTGTLELQGVRAPVEILRKPAPLTDEERDAVAEEAEGLAALLGAATVAGL